MIKFFKLSLAVGVVLFLASCATAMSPMEVNNTLPTLTDSKLLSQSQAEEAIKTNKCKYLVKGREYVAPIATSKKGDLKNGARGIDEWVKLDGGNAYVLFSYKWVIVDNNGSTQLHLVFDTMLCE